MTDDELRILRSIGSDQIQLTDEEVETRWRHLAAKLDTGNARRRRRRRKLIAVSSAAAASAAAAAAIVLLTSTGSDRTLGARVDATLVEKAGAALVGQRPEITHYRVVGEHIGPSSWEVWEESPAPGRIRTLFPATTESGAPCTIDSVADPKRATITTYDAKTDSLIQAPYTPALAGMSPLTAIADLRTALQSGDARPAGRVSIAGRAAYRFRVPVSPHQTQTYWLDAATFVPIQSTIGGPKNGEPGTIAAVLHYLDWQTTPLTATTQRQLDETSLHPGAKVVATATPSCLGG